MIVTADFKGRVLLLKEVEEALGVKENIIVHFDDKLGVGAKVSRPLEGDDGLDGKIAVRVMEIPVKDVLKGSSERKRGKQLRLSYVCHKSV